MKRRILSVLMCICMTLGLLPISALATGVTEYNVWVGGVRVTSENASNITGDGITGTVRYDAASSTLTLNNASITGTYENAAIYASTGLTIALIGINTAIGPEATSSGSSYGVYCGDALGINGTGSLNAIGGKATGGGSYGVYSDSTFTISSGTVAAIGGKAANSSCGVFTVCGISYTGGLLVAKGESFAANTGAADNEGQVAASLTGTADQDFAVWGVSNTYTVLDNTLDLSTWSDDVTSHWNDTTGGYKAETLNGVKTLTLKNVIINAPDVTEDSMNAYGIHLPNSAVTIVLEGVNIISAGNASLGSIGVGGSGVSVASNTSGSLYTLAGSTTGSSGSSYGVYGAGVNVFGGVVTALGGSADSSGGGSYGVWGSGVNCDGVSVSGGTLTAVGGAAGSSIGLYGSGADCDGVSVSGGVVTAVGSSAKSSNGVYGYSSGGTSVSVSDGVVTAIGGSATVSSMGVYGMYGKSSVSVSGGVVTAVGSPATDSSCGVYGSGSITLSGIVNATGGTADNSSYGVRVSGLDGSIILSGAIIATGGTASGSYGVYCDNGTVSVTGGTVTAMGNTVMVDSGNSCGVYCSGGTVSVVDGTITAMGNTVTGNSGNSYGVYGDSVAVEASGVLMATGGAADGSSYGVHVLGGNTILSGTIIATGGSASSSYGVRSESGTISVTSGRVTATGGTADNTSSGVFSNSRVNVSGGTVTASSGAAGNFSQAMNRAPIYAANCGIIASTNTDGSSAAASYDVSSITSYKYLKIGNLYPLTVNLNGGSGTTANGVHMAGDNVSINAGAKSGYTFSGWTSTGGGTFASAANTSTIYTMPAGAAAITANWTLVYTLTVNLNGGSGATINGIYKAGDVVSIDAGAKSGYTFSGWTSTGGTFASAANTSTTFTMPAGAAVITASWAANSSGNSSGNSSSGSSSSGTLTVPVSSDADKINVSASVSGNTATIKVTDTQLKEIISRTEAGTVKIDMSGLKVDTVAIPAAVISAAGGASGSTSLAVALPTGTVTLDKTALASIAGKGDIKFSVETVANKNLTDSQRKVLGTQADSAVVVDVNVFVNGTQTSTFRDGKITVSVPYMSKSGENIDSITVWFIKDDGTIESKNGVYNAATGYVEFTTVHLSRYLIVNFPFADVAENSWYYGSVAYAYNNGLFVGTSDTTFSPDSAMTRQMIWMTLARMDSKTPADMEAARDWAMKNGISDGTNPANSITRQQMAIILYRFAQYKGYDTTQGGMVIRKFTDYDSISEYALPALSWAVNAGLMQGNSNNLMHAGSATRAQVATILQRFCQSVAR